VGEAANRSSIAGSALLWVVGILPGAIGLLLLVSCLLHPPTYVYRLLFWGFADVGDYRRFPAQELATGPSDWSFGRSAGEARVAEIFEAQPEVDRLDAFLASHDTQAFLVIQDDAILYEKYFSGMERDSIVTSFSVAKSFVSALVGIAIDEGRIADVGDPITDYLPELAERDPRFSRITIRDLLRMSSGIRYQEFPSPYGDDAKTYYYPDLRALALEQTEVVDEPGAAFLYNNYHPLLLGLILERATGVPVAEYLQERIWEPLGMEYPGSWSLDSIASGFPKMESGINARAIDFARFGRLYLNGGTWQGLQIVSAAWVEESTRMEPVADRRSYYPEWFDLPTAELRYGYLWWGIRRGEDECDFAAEGNLGQIIYVSPRSKLIMVKNASSYGDLTGSQWNDLFSRVAASFANQ
jgi:CubicO group peptidase (beta-lactamase class C family)